MDNETMPTGEAQNMVMVRVNPAGEVAIQNLYMEALKLKDYAVARVILIDADLKPATEELSIQIRELREQIKLLQWQLKEGKYIGTD